MIHFDKKQRKDIFSLTTPEEVLNELKTFKLNKASGCNSIPAKMLEDRQSEISVPLSTLVNFSLNSGIFPAYLKLAMFMPILKKGDQQDCNYQTLAN